MKVPQLLSEVQNPHTSTVGKKVCVQDGGGDVGVLQHSISKMYLGKKYTCKSTDYLIEFIASLRPIIAIKSYSD